MAIEIFILKWRMYWWDMVQKENMQLLKQQLDIEIDWEKVMLEYSKWWRLKQKMLKYWQCLQKVSAKEVLWVLCLSQYSHLCAHGYDPASSLSIFFSPTSAFHPWTGRGGLKKKQTSKTTPPNTCYSIFKINWPIVKLEVMISLTIPTCNLLKRYE